MGRFFKFIRSFGLSSFSPRGKTMLCYAILLYIVLFIPISVLSSTTASASYTLVKKWTEGVKGEGWSLATDSSSNLYIAYYNKSIISKFTSDGTFVTEWGSYCNNYGDKSCAQGTFNKATSVAVDNSGYVYVVDDQGMMISTAGVGLGVSRIQKFTSDGTPVKMWSFAQKGCTPWDSGSTACSSPFSIAVDNKGYLYVTAGGTYDKGLTPKYKAGVVKYTDDGTYVSSWGFESVSSSSGHFVAASRLYGIAADSSGNVFVCDYDNGGDSGHKIYKFSNDGTYITEWGGYGKADNQLLYPQQIAVDSSGYVYVADVGSFLIKIYDNNGTFVNKFSPGVGSRTVALDSSGHMYLSDGLLEMLKYAPDSSSSDATLASAAITAAYNRNPSYYGTLSGGVTTGTASGGGTYYIQKFTSGKALLAYPDGYMWWYDGTKWNNSSTKWK
ncbi:MAG: hypothetical protein HQL01_08740 [Nitrospirae bacterium]|nr:hypothetical protein [Nitrospirota bacterium]